MGVIYNKATSLDRYYINTATLFIAIAFMWIFISSAHALKAPHASPNITLCSDCHSRTGAGFATITSQNVLCINAIGCHKVGGVAEKRALSILDASNRFGNLPTQSAAKQSSHGWKIPNLNPDAGVTQTNKWGELNRGPQGNALNNKLLCTRCHRAHGEKAGYTIYDKFLRENPKGNYICFQCHAARQISNVRDPKPADKHYSHPVEVNYSTVQASKPDFFEKVPLNPYSSNPSAALKLFTSYSNQKGNVVCQTCHGPLHASDSNPYTLDNLTTFSKTGNYSTSEGNLLRRYPLKKSNDLCASCHKVQTHKTFMCNRCHTPHKKAGENNRYLVHENISTPNSGRKAVQFVSTSNMAQRYGESNKMCQVCHTTTRYHRNYSSASAKRDHKFNSGSNNYRFCPDCHLHTRGFSSESIGNTACSTEGCHDDFFGPMNTVRNGYHHYLNNANVTILASGSKYPVVTPQPGTVMGDRSDQNRRCMMCHVEHDIFKDTLNWQSPGRAYNLRYDISILPNRTTHGNNTDFVPSTHIDAPKAPNGGICLSCHQNSQFKSYTQADGTTRTPIINRTLFEGSPHNFTAPATFNSNATIFNANCSKCHIDTLNKSKQGAGNAFGPHYSKVRRIQAGSTDTNNTGSVSTTGTDSTHLADSTKGWEIDIWQGFTIKIIDGTGVGQSKSIINNDATRLTLSSAWTTIPNTTSKYLIGISREFDSGTATGGTTTKIRDNTKTWTRDYWKDRPVTIIAGTGRSQTRQITFNTATGLTVGTAWSPAPDTTSEYSIGDPMEEEQCYKCHSRQSNPNAYQYKDYYGQKLFDNTKTLKMEELFNDAAKPYKHRIANYFAKHRGDESITAPTGATATGWYSDTSVSGGLHTGCADCHNPHGNRKPGEDNGVATGGSAGSIGPPLVPGTLVDSSKNWSQDQWRGYTLRLMDGAGRGQDRIIVGNTATSLTLAASFVTSPASGTYYIITPIGLPNKGNNLWNPNSGTWGVAVNYGTPTVDTMAAPTFKKITTMTAGTNKIYQLCFKCHSEYGWGTSGAPFTIPDSFNASGGLAENQTTNIAQEFNPNNLGYHPVVDIGANQPINVTGFDTVDIVGSFTATGGSSTSVTYTNTWNPNKYNGMCVEITGGTGSGQVRSITGHNSTGITAVDPNFSTAPANGSTFIVRKCSSFSSAWPRFTGGTLNLTAGLPTATITGLTNGIPSTVINGWYIYAGTVSGSPLAPPQLTTKGWFQIAGIGAGASNSGTTTVTLTVTPTPTQNYNSTYALSAGLGNTFVPPYGPWSVMGCADCHDTDDSRDPSGPHASARNWMVRMLESQIFAWYYGGTGEGASTTDPSLVKVVGYPDGGDAGWSRDMSKSQCLNCHRSDVYTANNVGVSGGSFVNYAARNMGRQTHLPYDVQTYTNSYGIFCMYCHGGDNRPIVSGSWTGPYSQALGGIHGSNLGAGTNSTQSFRGRRLINGGSWTGITRSATNTSGTCSTRSSNISSCGTYGGSFGTANYPYYSGADMYMPIITSAVAADASGGHTGVQAGDTVVIRFDGETQANTINASNINSALSLSSSHVWGTISNAVWSTTTYQNDTLTVTLGSGSSIAVGDTISLASNVIIKNILGTSITGSTSVTGSFGFWVLTAIANDNSGSGPGIQAGDQVVIRFDGATTGTAITSDNVNSALALNNGHSWLDGGAIGSATWSTTTYSNDTLTITLSATTSAPSVATGDMITLGTVIKDSFNNTITNLPFIITGTFSSIPTGAVGLWRFDENTATTAYDDTTNNNHGTITSGSWTTGKSGYAITFNGSSTNVNVPDSDTLDLTTAGTLEMWVKKNNATCNYQYISKGNDYRLYEDGSCRLVFKWGTGTLTTDQALINGAWYHIAATYDAAGNRNIYLNGQLVKSSSSVANAAVNATDLRIGNYSTSWFNGIIDSVVVYNRAITAQEAADRYNRVKSATANNNSGLGAGIQANDQVVIRFNTATQANTIDASNINTALALSGAHTWRDGSNAIGSAVWSTTTYTNDTLTITLSAATSAPTVKVGDVITMGGIVKDGSARPIIGTVRVGGSFGAVTGMPDGVVGYWKLDEAAGTAAADSSGLANTGTTTASPSWVAGRFNNAFSLNGSSNSVTVADSDSLDLTEQVTLEVWSNKTTNKAQTYISKGAYVAAGGDEYAIYEDDTSGTVKFRWGGIIVASAVPIQTGTWNYIVGTYDGATAKIYVNGVLSNSATGYSIISAGTNALYLGRNSSGSYFGGLLDDAVVYNRALTGPEVAGRYAANLKTAVARDTAGNGRGMQAGDKVVITFDGPTNGATINAANIDTVLGLTPSHTWKDVSGNIGSAVWSNTLGNNNDTLTITLSSASGLPTVAVSDIMTLGGGIIQDTSARPIIGTTVIGGTFDSLLSGVVAQLNMDENSGVTTYDASVNNNHGLLTSTTWTTGLSGSALNFNGSTSKVTVADSNSLDLTNAGTVEFWIKKANDTTSSQTYLYKANTVYIRDNGTTGQLVFQWSTGTALTTDMRINAGIWYHIATVYDGANLKIYINGELSKSVAYSTNATANTNPLYIGSTGSSSYLAGIMDGLVIYNRALDATEVRQRYGSNIKSADADDNSAGGSGIQAGDRVVIRFSEATNGEAINAGNIAAALALNAGSWLDGAGGITSAVWSTTTYTNDTLTVTLRANTSAPTLKVGNTITLNGTIKDAAGYPIYGSIAIGGSFGAISGMLDGAVAYWKLDESSGTAAADQSMNGNNGTVTGATWTTGRYNNALSFSGSNQYVTVTDSNSLDLFKKGTIEFWTKKNANNSNQTYVSKGSAIPYFLVSESGTTGRVVFTWGAGSVTTTNAVPLGVWNHVVCVYDGTDLMIYVNGVLAVTPAAFQLQTLAPNSSPVYLGRASGGNYLNGALDDVVIYNRALTAGEVQQRFINTFRDARSYDISLADVGVQVGDQAVIRFIGATDGPVINAGNIDSALPLSSGHTWKDVGLGIGSAVWSNTGGYSNDTLTITLSASGGIPTVAGADTISLGTLIKDSLARSITGTTTLLNDFDVPIETIGYWRYNESSGTSAYDTSASANNGTVTGATWTTGKFNNALSFNGVSDWYVNYPAISDYTLSGNYTMEAWVKPTSWPTNGDGAILYNGGAFFLYNFALYSDGKIGLSYNSTGSMIGRNIAKATTPLTLNDWNHVLITRNAGVATFYVNGVASTVSVNGGGATATFTENHYTTTNGSLYTGRSYFNPDYYYFPGIIDEVVMYKNKFLTATEVKRRYRTWMSSVRANNNSGGGSGIQSGDQVVIKFDGATTAQTINAGNIETALALSNGHTWGSITSANWSTTTNTNDTLTITLNTGATVNVGDTITLGGVIKDDLYRTITGTKMVSGSFATIPSGAVAYYKMDETAGTTMVDATTNNNNGTMYGGATRVAGKSGTGLSFNGTDAYVEVANTSFSLANAMSVEVWVKAADQANGNGVVDANAAGIKSWSSGGNEVIPAVTTTSGYGGSGFVVGGNVFDNTNWHHLVLTWDGTTQYLYVDGNPTPVGSKTWTGTLVANTTLRMGRIVDGAGFYNGLIDEVVIYNTALTPAQVTNRYNNP